jgi:hypothetical protein
VPADLGPVIAIAAGLGHTAVVLADGTVRCWGLNSYGQCVVPAGLASVRSIIAGQYFTTALRSDGTLACWGYTAVGSCAVPVGLGPVDRIAAGYLHLIVTLLDTDADGWPDSADNCPNDFNPDQRDGDGDGVGDPCDPLGDLDGDGQVSGSDIAVLLGNWGGSGVGDINGDGVVDAIDLALMLGEWG